MKNISVSVDEETHGRLKATATEQGTSVSAIIREFIDRALHGNDEGHKGETESERHRRELLAITEEFQREGIGISMKDNQTREEIYQRNAPC